MQPRIHAEELRPHQPKDGVDGHHRGIEPAVNDLHLRHNVHVFRLMGDRHDLLGSKAIGDDAAKDSALIVILGIHKHLASRHASLAKHILVGAVSNDDPHLLGDPLHKVIALLFVTGHQCHFHALSQSLVGHVFPQQGRARNDNPPRGGGTALLQGAQETLHRVTRTSHIHAVANLQRSLAVGGAQPTSAHQSGKANACQQILVRQLLQFLARQRGILGNADGDHRRLRIGEIDVV